MLCFYQPFTAYCRLGINAGKAGDGRALCFIGYLEHSCFGPVKADDALLEIHTCPSSTSLRNNHKIWKTQVRTSDAAGDYVNIRFPLLSGTWSVEHFRSFPTRGIGNVHKM